MQAKELIAILKKYPDAEVLVSTTQYYDSTKRFIGYERGESQAIKGFKVNQEINTIELNGSK
ncbi:hypothetical protein [Enterococcus mundtii]|uniref:hypothetical protein n=1 Tax=Enterococcus mundtii TaxID=53346 RepID=UPI000E086750|nr:hypothetical protein [Enterococcus mundtii]STE38104.1 Uncharacterised protein [Enterococcus mundtii]